MAAWLLLAVGDNRARAGNDGYDDQPDSYYSWDSTVPNHGALAQGDLVVLWDKTTSLGMSVIEEVLEPVVEQKMRHKCPNCHKAHIQARKRQDASQRYRCYACKAVFGEPESRLGQVTRYRERHDAAWFPLDGIFTGAELRCLGKSPKSQLSIRRLDWDRFQSALAQKGMADAAGGVAGRAQFGGSDGHVRVVTRIRLGQAGFRRRLLERQGPICAVTGPQPSEVLEAAHLYSYAKIGQHHDHGGLLLRRDIHSLFDRGALAVDPKTLEVSLSGHLMRYDTYRSLEGTALVAPVTPEQRRWLAVHWSQFRDES